MDLQISVLLLFILFTAGHSLRCYECETHFCEKQIVKTCTRGFSKCASSMSLLPVGGNSVTMTGKSCVTECHSGSLNTGDLRTSVVCCNTDLCNAQDAPDPRSIPANGKTCYYCEGNNCSNIMRCSGTEDRCYTITGTSQDELRVKKGCISKSICEAQIGTSTAEVVTCCEGNLCNCEGNLCNGAQSVTQSFLFLCCSLLSYFLLH